MNKLFEPKPPLRIKDLSEIDLTTLLAETYTITAIQTEKKTQDGTVLTVSSLELFFLIQTLISYLI